MSADECLSCMFDDCAECDTYAAMPELGCYDTVSIAVPIWILTEAINDAMTITWLDAA
jgi:hypothetical protein